MDKLEAEYPNTATAMSGMTDRERIAYIAQVELVATMKMWNEPPKRKGK